MAYSRATTKWDGNGLIEIHVLPGGKVMWRDTAGPVEPAVDNDMGDGWYGPRYIWRDCNGSNRPARLHQTYDTKDLYFKCSGCELVLPEEHPFLTPLGEKEDTWSNCRVKMGLHKIPMTLQEQAKEKIDNAAEAIGFDRHDDVVLHARYQATSHEMTRYSGESLDAMVATGVGILAKALAQRAAFPAAQETISKMLSFQLESNDWLTKAGAIHGYKPEDCEVPDEAPFFTEAVLYPLLGKEDARTVLAYVNAAARAVGASRKDQ